MLVVVFLVGAIVGGAVAVYRDWFKSKIKDLFAKLTKNLS